MNGANMATWYLENVIRDGVKDKNVLELGAGVGFTSLVSNALGAKSVLITDGNADVLRLADANIELNSKGGKVGTARLQWNTDDEMQSQVADTAWDFISQATSRIKGCMGRPYVLYQPLINFAD